MKKKEIPLVLVRGLKTVKDKVKIEVSKHRFLAVESESTTELKNKFGNQPTSSMHLSSVRLNFMNGNKALMLQKNG